MNWSVSSEVRIEHRAAGHASTGAFPTISVLVPGRRNSLATIPLLNQGKMPPEVLPFLNAARAPAWNPGLILTDDFSPFDILQGSG